MILTFVVLTFVKFRLYDRVNLLGAIFMRDYFGRVIVVMMRLLSGRVYGRVSTFAMDAMIGNPMCVGLSVLGSRSGRMITPFVGRRAVLILLCGSLTRLVWLRLNRVIRRVVVMILRRLVTGRRRDVRILIGCRLL